MSGKLSGGLLFCALSTENAGTKPADNPLVMDLPCAPLKAFSRISAVSGNERVVASLERPGGVLTPPADSHCSQVAPRAFSPPVGCPQGTFWAGRSKLNRI